MSMGRASQDDWTIHGILRAIWARRRFIASVTGAVAVGAVIISLILPKSYLGVASVLLPSDSDSGLLSAALGDLAPTAAAFIGGGSRGDYQRFRAILESRTVGERIVREFDLINAYDLADSEAPLDDALETLAERSEFTIDAELDFLSVEVYDRQPQRAADLANAFVRLLNERNMELASQDAAQHRAYLARIVQENEGSLQAARDSLASFQRRHGIVDLPAQTTAFYESLAAARGELLRLEIAYEAALAQYGENNPQTRHIKSSLDAANASLSGFYDGHEAILPLAREEMPGVASGYGNVLLEVMIEAEIAQLVRPLYEQARFDETRSRTAVQVLDEAHVPARKARPRRAVIVVMATLSALFGCILYIMAVNWIRTEAIRP